MVVHLDGSHEVRVQAPRSENFCPIARKISRKLYVNFVVLSIFLILTFWYKEPVLQGSHGSGTPKTPMFFKSVEHDRKLIEEKISATLVQFFEFFYYKSRCRVPAWSCLAFSYFINARNRFIANNTSNKFDFRKKFS